MKRQNAWYVAICEQLRVAGGPLAVEQIWARMEAAGFQHASRLPRSTLGARVAELVQQKRLSRVGPATYQLGPELLAETPVDLRAEMPVDLRAEMPVDLRAEMPVDLSAEVPVDLS